MSLFGAMDTSVSGLTAQAAAFTNISDNVANAQTVGFKGVETTFQDYLTSSSASANDSGAVETTPIYTNNVQGTIQSSTDPLALAISGQGFFSVSEAAGEDPSGNTILSTQQYYTRAGDFQLDKNGYLVNSSGDYLDGWLVNGAGVADQSQVKPIQVNVNQSPATATSNITLAANLPASGSSGTSSVQVYDAIGTQHTVDIAWSAPTGVSGGTQWTATMTDPSSGASLGTADVVFGTNGTISSITQNGTTTTSANQSEATITLNATYNGTPQSMNLDLGGFGETNGVTQFAGTTYDQISSSTDGHAAGSYTGVMIDSKGNVNVSYSNGQTQTIAQVPITTFADPDALQRQNGQAFTATQNAGTPVEQYANENAAGTLTVGSVEASNVDIATQLSQLIVAQEAYGANSKVITSSNQLLQQTINMVQ